MHLATTHDLRMCVNRMDIVPVGDVCGVDLFDVGEEAAAQQVRPLEVLGLVEPLQQPVHDRVRLMPDDREGGGGLEEGLREADKI